MRAHFLKLSLRALDSCEPTLREEARARLAVRCEQIERARSLSWLPIEHLLEMSELAQLLGGEPLARRVVLDTMRLACATPPWGQVVRAAVSAFGLHPPAVARWSPPLYRLAFRGTGRMRVTDVDATSAKIAFEGVPAQCLTKESYVRSLGHALEFFFELAETPGTVELHVCDPVHETLSFHLRCQEKPA